MTYRGNDEFVWDDGRLYNGYVRRNDGANEIAVWSGTFDDSHGEGIGMFCLCQNYQYEL